MKDLVNRREEDVIRIEQQINDAQDKGSKSILAIQLKAAQKELKDALINLSMADKVFKTQTHEKQSKKETIIDMTNKDDSDDVQMSNDVTEKDTDINMDDTHNTVEFSQKTRRTAPTQTTDQMKEVATEPQKNQGP